MDYSYIKDENKINDVIRLAPIDGTNKKAVLALSVAENQKDMLEPIEDCLHDARTNAYDMEWETSAILLNDEVIGFAMYGIYHSTKKTEYEVWLDRFMISHTYQGRGWGKSALTELILMLTAKYQCAEVYLSVYKDNEVAIALYKKLGFKFNGEKDVHGESVMILKV